MPESAIHYLIVVPVRVFPVSKAELALESAFGEHLKLLRRALRPEYSSMTIAAPSMPREDYEASRDVLGRIDSEADGIEFVPLHGGGLSGLGFALRSPAILARVLREVSRADLVHAGPSHDIKRPIEIASIAAGWMLGKKTLAVADIDLRNDARMNLATGAWTRGAYLRCRYLYDPLRRIQLHAVGRFASLVLFKGQAMVDAFGHGRDAVKSFLDAAYSIDHVLEEDALRTKTAALQTPGPLELCYFGRLVPYKGVDRIIEALARAREHESASARLRVIGSGPIEGALRELASRRRVSDAVRFLGPRPYGPSLFRELQNAELMMAAPLSGDTPRNALDALALGLPLVAFDVAYYRDLARHSGAVELVPWDDVDALAERIAYLAEQRHELAPRVAKAVAFARRNTQELWLERRTRWTKALHGSNDSDARGDASDDTREPRAADWHTGESVDA